METTAQKRQAFLKEFRRKFLLLDIQQDEKLLLSWKLCTDLLLVIKGDEYLKNNIMHCQNGPISWVL